MANFAVKSADSSIPAQARFVAALFERERNALLSYLVSLLRHKADAEDVLQETYVRLLQSDSLDTTNIARARSYVFKAATNLAYDRFRRRKNIVDSAHSAEDLADGDTPQQILSFEQSLAALKEVLLSLEPRCRRVFLLRTAEGISYEAIATTLGVSKRTVERDMKRALDACQEKLKDSG